MGKPAKPKRKGNYKPGPGRPPGRKNNKTLALEEAARKPAADIDGAFDGDAHAFLQAVYRNPDVPLEVRIMAAGRALRVEKPTLSASRNQVDVNMDFGDQLAAARERVKALAGPGGELQNMHIKFDDAECIELE
ncbi:hypothetical protein [Marinobacter sp.]|uniref:hypothetical protein n=1 Tax=Marinobacter sp. TaxID=50741 RepID=UPI003299BBF3